jgi:hypothetical protein
MVRRRSTVRFRNVAPSSQVIFEKKSKKPQRPWWGLTVSINGPSYRLKNRFAAAGTAIKTATA